MSILVAFIAATVSQSFAAEQTIVQGFSYDGVNANVTYLCRSRGGRGEIRGTSPRDKMTDAQRAQFGQDMLASAATVCQGLPASEGSTPTAPAKPKVPGQVECAAQGAAMGRIWANSVRNVLDVVSPPDSQLTGPGGLRGQGGGCFGTDEEFQGGFRFGSVVTTVQNKASDFLASFDFGSGDAPKQNASASASGDADCDEEFCF